MMFEVELFRKILKGMIFKFTLYYNGEGDGVGWEYKC